MLEMNFISIFLKLFSPEVITILVGASPISELRGAIPLALGVFGFPPLKAFLFSWFGNLIPAIFLLIWLGPISDFLSRHSLLAKKFFDWLFVRTRKKFSVNYETLGSIALIVFVAIPFPLTGVWSGSVAAFLFGFSKRRSFFLISLGAAIAGIIVTITSLGLLKVF